MQNQQSKHYISKKLQLRDCRGMIPSWDPMVQKPEKITEHGNIKSYNLILFTWLCKGQEVHKTEVMLMRKKSYNHKHSCRYV